MISSVKITVVVPVYNVEDYLEACLTSLCEQTLQEIEIICVDDGSTDSSAKILESFSKKDQRIKVLTQENQGLSMARNSGLKVAQGNYVYFLDSDDYLENPEALHKMYNAVYPDDIDILSFNYRTIEMEEKTYYRPMAHNEVLDGKSYLMKNGMWGVMVWLRLYKRSYLQKIHFEFKAGITSEDDEALPRLYNDAAKVKHIKDVLLVYRRRENSISTSKTSMRLIDGLVAIVQTYAVLVQQEKEATYNKYLYQKLLEYLFILYEKSFSVEASTVAKQKYEILVQDLPFSALERALIKNEEQYIYYHNIEKKSKKSKLSVYYIRRFRTLYFKYLRLYGV